MAHLAGKKNEGLPILRCVHDDGDEEDLDEEEATTAVGDYARNCLTKSESNSFVKERKRQLEVEMQSLLRAQGDAQIFKANSLTKAALLAEACKRANVECIGYHCVTNSAAPVAISEALSESSSLEGNHSDSFETKCVDSMMTSSVAPSDIDVNKPIVLKRFTNCKEAASFLLRSVKSFDINSEIEGQGIGIKIDKKKSEGGDDISDRTISAAWRKEITNCCRGYRPFFLGLKWQFVFPPRRMPNNGTLEKNNSSSVSSKVANVDMRINTDALPESEMTVAATAPRRPTSRSLSVADDGDPFSLLRQECSQAGGTLEGLPRIDLSLIEMQEVIAEYISDSESSEDDESSDSDEEQATKREEKADRRDAEEGFLNGDVKRTTFSKTSRKPKSSFDDVMIERKMPSLGEGYQAEVPRFGGISSAEKKRKSPLSKNNNLNNMEQKEKDGNLSLMWTPFTTKENHGTATAGSLPLSSEDLISQTLFAATFAQFKPGMNVLIK